MTMRSVVRRRVPLWIRWRVRLIRRWATDRSHGARFASSAPAGSARWPAVVSSYERAFIDYPGQEALATAKRLNQRILARSLTGVVIQPGEVFSVWRLAQRPSSRHGYAHAAALKDGRLTTDIGGAICLLSTVVYNVALLGGLRIIERHAHSVDSYGERRYFELGRDAAVEHPYRDLRFANPHSVPVQLLVIVDENRILGELRAAEPQNLVVQLDVSEPEPLRAKDLVRLDRSLRSGEEVVERSGIPGLRVHTTRLTRFETGRRLVEDLGETVHQAQPRVVRRNSGS